MTLGVAENLAVLRARPPRIPLRDTAEVAGRRLADHLRETGWNVYVQLSGSGGACRDIAAVCAIRTAERPAANARSGP